jgi:methyltransferase
MVTSEALYLGFLGLLAMERGVELLISKANGRAAFASGAFEVERGHYRWMAAMHAAFFVSCATEVLVLHRPFPGAFGFVALGLVVLAQLLRYAAVRALGKRWNVRIIVWPLARPVTSGPYRFVRHPNYVAVAVELACVPLVHGALFTAFVFSIFNAAVLAVRIRDEERALGPGYAEVFRDRPRMIPKLFGG